MYQPTGRSPHDLADDLHGALDVPPLLLLADLTVVEPPVGVARDFVPGIAERATDGRVLLQRPARGERGQGQPPRLELAQDAPYASTGAVLVHALDARIPLAGA